MGFDEGLTHCSMLFDPEPQVIQLHEGTPDLSQYVEIIVFFSGGKDSVATVLLLLELGVDPARIELHHHLVDGEEGSDLMDWPCTDDYCRQFALAFGMRYVKTWRVGGFEAEMLRQDSPTGPVMMPDANGTMVAIGGKGPKNTRRKFPQVSNDQSVRWCSSYLKGDVAARYLTNTGRFQDGQKRLIVTGERAEESPSRAKYAEFCHHVQDNRNGKKSSRYLDHWRAVHHWKEAEIWAIMERHGVNPHLAYKIGYSRCSCSACVFIANDNWATLKFVAPAQFAQIAKHEADFGVTIHRTLDVTQRAERGTVMPDAQRYRQLAMSREYLEPIRVSDWKLPAGAFKGNGGNF